VSNTKTAQRKAFKWADFQREADRRSVGTKKRPVIEPFVIDDVQPPIIIPPPDEKTTLVISEQIGIVSTEMLDPRVGIQRVLPLLRAFCGDQFPRIWALLPEENTTEAVYVLMQALVDHFKDALAAATAAAEQAAELPGGSKASSA
jgi:hypothetical protein